MSNRNANAWHITESGPSAHNIKLKEVKKGIGLLIILNENYNDVFLKDVNSWTQYIKSVCECALRRKRRTLLPEVGPTYNAGVSFTEWLSRKLTVAYVYLNFSLGRTLYTASFMKFISQFSLKDLLSLYRHTDIHWGSSSDLFNKRKEQSTITQYTCKSWEVCYRYNSELRSFSFMATCSTWIGLWKVSEFSHRAA